VDIDCLNIGLHELGWSIILLVGLLEPIVIIDASEYLYPGVEQSSR